MEELTLKQLTDRRSRQIYSVSQGRRSFAAVSHRKMVSTSSLELRVDRLEQPDCKYNYNGYTVKIGEHRVLTITTSCPTTATTWLKEVLKKRANTKYGKLILGISIDVPKDGLEKEKLIQICTGSHCLIFKLPPKEDLARFGRYGFRITPALEMMKKLFGSPKVFAVAPSDADANDGMKMQQGSLPLIKALNEEYGIVIANPVELASAATLAQKAMEIEIRDYWAIAASNAAAAGPWYEDWRVPLPIQFGDYDMLTDHKVMFSALKTYLSFLIGTDNLRRQIEPQHSPSISANKKKN